MLNFRDWWKRFKCKFCCASKCELLDNIDDVNEIIDDIDELK